MSIVQGQNANASDFINAAGRNATPSNDVGRVPKLESDGRLSGKFLNATITSGTSTPLSVTTDGLEKILVIAKGNIVFSPGNDTAITVTLAYNGVTKDTVVIQAEVDNLTLQIPFTLIYTETPTSGTRDITVAATAGSLGNLVIMAIKL